MRLQLGHDRRARVHAGLAETVTERGVADRSAFWLFLLVFVGVGVTTTTRGTAQGVILAVQAAGALLGKLLFGLVTPVAGSDVGDWAHMWFAAEMVAAGTTLLAVLVVHAVPEQAVPSPLPTVGLTGKTTLWRPALGGRLEDLS